MPEVVNTSALSFDADRSADAEGIRIEDDRPTAIKVENVSMVFNMASERLNNLKEYFLKIVKHQLFFEELVALDDISFEVKKGDVFGILGTNGSGKSTLLKIVAGVLEPTRGKVEINGAIAPLIELGAGFDMDLSARENIYLNGALLGYSKEFIQEHFDDIVEFAEVEKFLDMPMKNYSSGMVARIAFAIATVMVPEILIVDEVLSVGDFMFQQKCEDRITELIERHGVTVLIVSHSNDQIERLCNKAIWIEKGHARIMGDANDVCMTYRILGGRTGSAQSERSIFDVLQRQISGGAVALPHKLIDGNDRFETAASLSAIGWPDGSESVIVVPDYSFTFSALAAGVAGALDAPILPVKEDEIPLRTYQTIVDLHPDNIIVFGYREFVDSTIGALDGLGVNAKLVPVGCERSISGLRQGLWEYALANDLFSAEGPLIMIPFSDIQAGVAYTKMAYRLQLPLFVFFPEDETLCADITTMFDEGGPRDILALESSAQPFEFPEIASITVTRCSSSTAPQEPDAIKHDSILILSKSDAKWQNILSISAFSEKVNAYALMIDNTDLDSLSNAREMLCGHPWSNVYAISDSTLTPTEINVILSP